MLDIFSLGRVNQKVVEIEVPAVNGYVRDIKEQGMVTYLPRWSIGRNN
jgi:hypothetical protein